MTTIAPSIDARPPNRAGDASHAFRPTRWLQLAAAPTFAVMALLNALAVTPADILCSAGHGMSSLGGMTLMYAMMGVFHAGPWWKLLASRHGRRACLRVDAILIPDSK